MYTIYGRVKYYDENGICQGYVTGGWLKPYFKKIDGSSSESKWSTNPYQLDPVNEGYFSFDIEDFDLLGPEGVYRKGTDKLYLVFYWNSNDNTDTNKDSKNITHAALIDHTMISGVDDVELNLTISPVKGPNITSFSLPEDEIKTKQSVTMSETSILDENFFTPSNCIPEWYRVNIAQKHIYNGIIIFDSYKIDNTLYDWGDIVNEVVKSSPGTTSNSHTYNTAGIYNISITSSCYWGGVTTKSKSIKVKYNNPITDFNWTPTQTDSGKIKGKELITFNNITTDLDGRSLIYKYEWVIEDKNLDGSDNSTIYSNKDKSFKPTHIFMSLGTKNITLRTYWNDGFNDLISEKVKQIFIYEYSITPNFEWDKIVTNRSENVNFINTCTGDTTKIISVTWNIPDNWPASTSMAYTFLNNESSKFGEGSPDNTIRVDNSYNIVNNEGCSVKLHSNELRQIEISVLYDTGWENKIIKKTKSYKPNSYNILPIINVNTESPKGRYEEVVITNGTLDPNNLQYKCELIVNDYYMSCNIDNPTPGSVKDNTKIYLNLSEDFRIIHNYQNTNLNNINLKILCDDGWQRIERSVEKGINPVILEEPTLDFSWTPEGSIKNRNINVSFIDMTSDINSQHISSTWTINDEFEIYNPENPNYGISITNNNKIFSNKTKDFNPTHKFQSNKQHEIVLNWTYDDGFCEQNIEKSKILDTEKYSIEPDFISTPRDFHLGEIQYENVTEDVLNLIIDIDWIFHDRDGLNNDSDNIFTFNNMSRDDIIKYKWKYAPRRPFSCSSNPALNNKTNKTVKMEVKFDNGWSNNNKLIISKDFTAITNEINILGDFINNEFSGKTIYGQEEVKFFASFEDENGAIIPNTLSWLIQDSDISGNDLTSNETLMSLQYSPIKKFQSSGNKLITVGVHFDDGYGNDYIKDYDFNVIINPYNEPEYDISWTPLHPVIGETITFTSIFNDTRPYGKIERILVDFYNNGNYDKIDINNDNIPDVWEIQKDTIFYTNFDIKENINKIRINVNWNDGWNVLNFDIIKDIILSSLPPDVELKINKIQYNNYKLEILANDADGTIDKYKFDIYFKNPAVNISECIIKRGEINPSTNYCTENVEFGDYIKVSETDWVDNNVLWKKLSSNGYYKIEGFAKDNEGLTSSDIKELFINSPSITAQPPSGDTIICTKRCIGGIVKVYPFEVNVLKNNQTIDDDDDF